MNHPRDLGQHPPQPPAGVAYPSAGPGQAPTNGQHCTVPPPPPRNRTGAILIVIIIVGLVVGAVTTAVLVTRNRDSAPANATAQSTERVAVTPPAQPRPSEPASGPSGTGRIPSSAGAPTGTAYGHDQPAVGACVDTARNSSGVLLYRADCDDPNTPLVLDRIVAAAEKCEPHGYASIRGFDGNVMCFAWNARQGDCLELEGPRKAPCSAGSPPNYGTVTVTALHTGGTDGTNCTDPNRWLQAGHGPTRGVACFMPTAMVGTERPATSAR